MPQYWTCAGCLGIFLDTQDCPNCANPKKLVNPALDNPTMVDDELRLYCLMRTDLHLFCIEPVEYNELMGKLMAQAGHAYVTTIYHALLREGGADLVDSYMQNAQPKITKKAKNENVLVRAQKECDAVGICNYLVKDAGRTLFKGPIFTCLGIGPVTRAQLPKYVDGLQLL